MDRSRNCGFDIATAGRRWNSAAIVGVGRALAHPSSCRPESDNPLTFVGEKDGIHYRLAYAIADGALQLTVTLQNTSETDFAPERLPLTLGVDSFMDSYPRWNDLFFPTFFRCEPTHLWGYMTSPHGRVLAVTSPDPVGSYTINYIPEMYGHYIYTVTLDLLQKPPVPGHHPPYVPLKSGEKRSWRIALFPISAGDAVKGMLAVGAQAPMLDLYAYTIEPGQPAEFTVFSQTPVRITVIDTDGIKNAVTVANAGDNRYTGSFSQTERLGYYDVIVESSSGKVSTGKFFVRPPWSWYLKQARSEALRLTPRADLGKDKNDACECWYGLLGFYLARKHFPDKDLDAKGDRILEKVLQRLFEETNGTMRSVVYKERIQNDSAMISVLVARYEGTGDEASLETAVKLAEYLLSRQHAKGYYGGYAMHPYTAVIYPAKSLMELMAVERKLGETNAVWKARYARHYDSVHRAMDDLATWGRDMKTEGGATYEDGAVTCAALQLAAFALLQEDPAARKKYLDPARRYLEDHRCLTRLNDTDCRSRSTTLRFWEAWGDVHMTPGQMMLSPHGWSAWRMYAMHYLYLLTGEEFYLRENMNALGAGMQLLHWPAGRLHYSFVPDPHLLIAELKPDAVQPAGVPEPTFLGEHYLKAIGEWYGRSTPGTDYLDRVEWGWTGDGTAFEIIKAMEEIALTAGYVLERADGSLIGYNCSVCLTEGAIEVIPAETIVRRVHVNLKTPRPVRVRFTSATVSADCRVGMQWLTVKNP